MVRSRDGARGMAVAVRELFNGLVFGKPKPRDVEYEDRAECEQLLNEEGGLPQAGRRECEK